MKPLLHPSSIIMFLFTVIILTNIPTSLRADNIQYVITCNNTFSCGSITNLTYPFWGDERPQYCGEPYLEIKCDGGVPKFTVDSVTYRIHAWDIKTQNLTVARDDYLEDGGICSSDHKNNTLDNTVFQYDDGFVNVTLLYNCSAGTATPPNPFQSCGVSTPLFYVVLEYMPNFACTSVVVPVPKAESQLVTSNPRAIQEVLQEGFGLKWPQSYDECNTCVESGGTCGNDDGHFACFCNDGSHKTSCSDSGMFLSFVNMWLASF